MAKTSLILLSGGLDSALSLVTAVQNSHVKLVATFDYFQNAAKQEIRSAQNICNHYGLSHQVIELPFFKHLSNHPLLGSQDKCPEPNIDELDDLNTTTKSADQVWVPNRNGIFLNVAASLAESQGIETIYVGFNAEEATTFADNSKDYVEALNKSLHYSTQNHVTVTAPTQGLYKTEILNQLLSADFPLTMLWSCYRSGETMCGRCESCQRLKRAFTQNKLKHKLSEFFLA